MLGSKFAFDKGQRIALPLPPIQQDPPKETFRLSLLEPFSKKKFK